MLKESSQGPHTLKKTVVCEFVFLFETAREMAISSSPVEILQQQQDDDGIVVDVKESLLLRFQRLWW